MQPQEPRGKTIYVVVKSDPTQKEKQKVSFHPTFAGANKSAKSTILPPGLVYRVRI